MSFFDPYRSVRLLRDMFIGALLLNIPYGFRMWRTGWVAFESDEGRPFRLDRSTAYGPMGHVYHRQYVFPNILQAVRAPIAMCPVNGDIVLGQTFPQYPGWILMQNGRWLQSRIAGKEVAVEVGKEEAAKARSVLA